MTKTDSPVRAHSEERESYHAFTKDKRTRINRSGDSIYSSHRSEGSEGEAGGERRRSYNPNFTRDNQLTESNRRQAEHRHERSFSSERGEGGYNREERSFNREGGERRSFDRSEGRFNREGGERRSFDRSEGRFNREGGERRSFDRSEGRFNREGGERRSFDRSEGRFNREGGERRSFDRSEGRFNRERREGRPTRGNAPRAERRTERRTEPKTYINTANHYTLDNYPSYAAPEQDGAIRLNRYISMSGICSRREADEYIASGAITVNGVVVTELGTKVMPGDEVRYNGEKIENEKKVYIVMNKPKGFVTTLDDPHADKSVMDLVRNACTERIYPVGRLDKNSVGVLLLTNDGDLAKKLTHPTYEKKKIYQVSLDKHLTRADLEQLILGITLEDGDIAADDVCYVDDPKCKNAVGIEIHSGRNRIVRRMFEHLGYHVGKLDRVYFAGLTKQKLKRGEWRFLTEKEVAMLKSGSYE